MSTHLFVYAISKFKDQTGKELSRWTRIGAAFPNSKGGFRIKLELVPTDPNVDVVAMPPREDDQLA